MKTKLEIVEFLCNSGAIDFKEALILLETGGEVHEKIELVDKEVSLNRNIDIVYHIVK